MLHRVPFTLGPEQNQPVGDGFCMRLSRDARKCVVFLGYPDEDAGPSGIICEGTGFLLLYQGGFYLVTARHVAEPLGDIGFCIRVNTKDGKSQSLKPQDKVTWAYHPDTTVDLAITEFGISALSGFDFLYLDEILLPQKEVEADPDFADVGDLCYMVGLWRVLIGNERNLPVVHTGHIARMPGEERIPVKDANNKRTLVDGYLIEAQTLSGLSGAPVFLRPSILMGLDATPVKAPDTKERLELIAYKERVALLGVWQAAWDAPAGEVVAADRGRQITVPVGMGVVVPASRILEVLELPILKGPRDAANRARDLENAATPQSMGASDSQKITTQPVEAATNSDENPDHREDFNRLVSAASKSKPKGDRT